MDSSNRSEGVVREWYGDEGWGVVDLPGHSGGCFVHFSHIDAPEHTYRELIPGQQVSITWEQVEQDGYPARAIRVMVGAARVGMALGPRCGLVHAPKSQE